MLLLPSGHTGKAQGVVVLTNRKHYRGQPKSFLCLFLVFLTSCARPHDILAYLPMGLGGIHLS